MQRFALIRERNELRGHYAKLLENVILELNGIADDRGPRSDSIQLKFACSVCRFHFYTFDTIECVQRNCVRNE